MSRLAVLIGASVLLSLEHVEVASAQSCCAQQYWVHEWKAGGGTCPAGKSYFEDWHHHHCCDTGDDFGIDGPHQWACLGEGDDPAHSGFPLDGSVEEGACTSTLQSTCSPPTFGPIQCDGLEGNADAEVDEGCGQDEYRCEHRDEDGHPIRFSSGSIELQPIQLFDGNPSGIEDGRFEYELRYGSHAGRNPAVIKTGESSPRIGLLVEDTNFEGMGFLDNYADRLIPEAGNLVWVSSRGVITFSPAGGGSYTSHGQKFHLVDLGTSADPRYRIEGVSSADKRTWTFSPFTYSTTPSRQFWVLHSYRKGNYGWDVTRTDQTRITKVVDTLGRELRFTHVLFGGAYRLASVAFAPNSTSAATTIATLSYRSSSRLDRIDRTGSYIRFMYAGPAQNLVTHVLVPATSGATPQIGLDTRLGNEAVLEAHAYVQLSDGRFQAFRTFGQNRHWYYQSSLGSTKQIDLDEPQLTGTPPTPVSCSSNACSSGYGCYLTADGGDNHCYLAHTYTYDTVTSRVTSETDAIHGTTTYGYYASGAPKYVIDPSGKKTTYAYDSSGNVVCMVRNDDDLEAALDPVHPENGCDPPATGPNQTVSIAYQPSSSTKSFASVLAPGNNTQWTDTYDTNGQLASHTETGYTRDVDAIVHQDTRTTTYSYDSLGRVASVDGPRPSTEANDVVQYEYWTAPGELKDGRLKLTRRFTSASASLVTTYDDYDAFGIAHTVVDPAGTTTTITPSADRLTWTIATSGGGLTSTSIVGLNPNGTVAYAIDPDGACLTYEYATSTGFASAPTKIKRSRTACGVLPIDVNTGEVEIRTYAAGYADPQWTPTETERLVSIERRKDGVTTFLANGFNYDVGRHLASYTGLDSTIPFTSSYAGDILTGVTAPGAVSPGSWKSQFDIDTFSRPAYLYRYLSGTSKQSYVYTYGTSFSAFPTHIARGVDGGSTSTSDFVYDDWGELVEAHTPEQGIVRLEYDKAANVIKTRNGVGTSLVRTSAITYDPVNRPTYVDNDLEHPVNCSTAPEGTPISDQQFRYDACDPNEGTFACNNTAGRLATALEILQCSGQQVVKKGLWYSYDGLGRSAGVSNAVINGTTVGAAASQSYSWTAGSRLEKEWSPPTATIYTAYTYSADGATTALATQVQTEFNPPPPISLISSIAQAPFGPMSSFTTGVDVPSTNGHGVLKFSASTRLDYALSTYTWKTDPASPELTPVIDYLDQTYQYAQAGLLQSRTDAALGTNSRYYQYDPLLRLTCEARGTSTSAPTSADCSTSSPKIGALLTYNDGATTSAPPDTRATAFLKTSGYSSTVPDAYQYAGGSGTPLQIVGSNQNLVLVHDALGRRTQDYTVSTGKGGHSYPARVYTYLPDGRLGSITGTATSGAFTLTIRYDANGQPALLNYNGTTYELFYDIGGRLISVEIIDTTGTITRWHYHYLGDQPIATTREVVSGGSTNVSRFWFIYDERGLIHNVLDSVGNEYFRASWDASGLRNTQLEATGMWVPFALPGQFILYNTGDSARPPIYLNGSRVYDPLLGIFLEPDLADIQFRTPEGYVYARNNQLAWEDPSGARSDAMRLLQAGISPAYGVTYWIDDTCADVRGKVAGALFLAQVSLQTCKSGLCQMDESARQAWIANLLTGSYTCQTDRSKLVKGGFLANGRIAGATTEETILPPYRAIRLPLVHLEQSTACQARRLAHEALHSTTADVLLGDIARAFPDAVLDPRDLQYFGRFNLRAYWNDQGLDHTERTALEEKFVDNYDGTCFPNCPDSVFFDRPLVP